MFIHFLVQGYLDFLQFKTVFDKAAVHIFKHVFQWTYAFIPLGVNLEIELLGHNVCVGSRSKTEAGHTPQLSNFSPKVI